jgi:hypothetical protein
MVEPPSEFPNAKLFEEVGRLCAAWAFLEVLLQNYIWRVLKVNEALGQHITYRLDAKQRWEMLCELAEAHDQELFKLLKANNKTMATLAADRNLVVHGAIQWHPVRNTVCWVIYKGAKKGLPQPCSTDFVTDAREKIQRLALALGEHAGLPDFKKPHG